MTPTFSRTPRWQTTSVAALLLVAVGFLFTTPIVVAGAAIPIAFAAYDALSAVPASAQLRAERQIDVPAASPGDHVTVTLTVTNTGTATAPDLRVVDGVPSELVVVSGTPRIATPLRTGATASTTYEVVAKRGNHGFDDPVAAGRSFAGSDRATVTLTATGDTSFEGLRAVDSPPTDTPIYRAGIQPTDQGGDGVEFYRTREYQHGDPLDRLNWRQYAKTGDLATVEFREEHARRTVLVVDARAPTRVSHAPGHPTATELDAYVSARIHDALTAMDVETILTAFGVPRDVVSTPGPTELPWAAPETATDAADILDAVEGMATENSQSAIQNPPTEGVFDVEMPANGDALRRRLPARADVVIVSPLLDNWPLELAGGLQPYGYPVTIISPDVTNDAASGGVLALHRNLRTTRLVDAGITVVDWDIDTPIDVALERSLAAITT